MILRSAAPVALIALAFAVAACGGDDSNGGKSGGGSQRDTASGTGPTKAGFIEKADQVCKRFRKRAAALEKQLESTSDNARQAAILQRLADESEGVVDAFDELGVPPGDAEVIGQYKKTGREQIGLVRRAAEALADGDTATASTLIKSGQETGGRQRGIAQGYGFKVCGSERQP